MSLQQAFLQRAGHCAGLFRLGCDVEAALLMVELLEQLLPWFEQAPAEVQQGWATLLSNMFSRQQAQDWLGLADDLQYELAALLQTAQA